MALKDIKESDRAFRAEHLRYRLERVDLKPQDNGETKVKAWYEFKPRSGRPTAYGRELGTFTPDEKAAFFEWVREVV